MRLLLSVTMLSLVVVGGCGVSNNCLEEKHKFNVYHNDRFQFSVIFPVDILEPQGEPDNGDGQIFISGDKKTKLIASGRHNAMDDTIEYAFKEACRGTLDDAKDREVTFKVQKDNWYIVFGIENGKYFYEKRFLVDGVFKGFWIEYPQTMQKEFGLIVEKISNEFQPE